MLLPGAYPTSATCDYHIRALRNSQINITFLTLDLPWAPNCSEVDHIIVYSVVQTADNDLTYKEVKTICGSEAPDSFTTFNSNILISFITKSSNIMRSGFQLKFETSYEECGNKIEASTGVILSPGYPHSYGTRYCEWEIEVCFINSSIFH